MKDEFLEEIKTAFLSQNLTPIRRMFFLLEDGVAYACPLVAWAIHKGQADRADPEIELDGGANSALEAATKCFGEDWTIGFLDSYDGQKQAKHEEKYLAGYALGLEAAKQLTPIDPPI